MIAIADAEFSTWAVVLTEYTCASRKPRHSGPTDGSDCDTKRKSLAKAKETFYIVLPDALANHRLHL